MKKKRICYIRVHGIIGGGVGGRLTCDSRAFVTALQTSLRYFSRYFGKSVANEDSSSRTPPLLSVAANGSIFH